MEKKVRFSGTPQVISSANIFKERNREVERETLVGFDDEAMKLIEQLMGPKKQLQIISIVGMAGLGKTTLARKVYRDPSVEYHFHVRAWTYVTQEPQKRDLLLAILRSSFDFKDDNSTSDEKLSEMLKRKLSGQRYLIVMDDIWDVGVWNELKWSFPDNKNGSRIIFTSRLADVTVQAQSAYSHRHHLRFLSEKESWDLFQQKLFGFKGCPSSLVEIGMNITRKCQGLPLAILVAAGLVAGDMTLNWWSQVSKDLSNSNGTGVGDKKQYMDTLALSYDHLPPHLKPCFLYFGVFPKDCEIPAWKLILLWVAEGFIPKTGEENLEDAAKRYLKDLVSRSLVLVVKRKSDGAIKACIVHDLLRNLCLKKAVEENFLEQLERYNKSCLSVISPKMLRRLCISYPHSFETIPIPSSENLQSILCCSGLMFNSCAELSNISFTEFRVLRVLDLSSVLLPTFATIIVQLIDLRYISIRTNKGSIPESISKLECLETLVVDFPDQRALVTKNIWKMVNLRHLILSGKYEYEDLCFKETESSNGNTKGIQLENLQTISCLSASPLSSDEILKRTPNLRKLRFSGTMNQKCLMIPNLDKLSHLENLKLLIKYKPANREPAILSSSDMFPVSLKTLTLSYTHLKWNELQKIGMLPNLEVLKLQTRACSGQRWETGDGGFHQLKYLKLEVLEIVEWDASSEQFPKLEHLKLVTCRRLKEIPLSLGDIYTLETIKVRDCSSILEQCACKIKEDQASKGNDLLRVSVSGLKYISM